MPSKFRQFYFLCDQLHNILNQRSPLDCAFSGAALAVGGWRRSRRRACRTTGRWRSPVGSGGGCTPPRARPAGRTTLKEEKVKCMFHDLVPYKMQGCENSFQRMATPGKVIRYVQLWNNVQWSLWAWSQNKTRFWVFQQFHKLTLRPIWSYVCTHLSIEAICSRGSGTSRSPCGSSPSTPVRSCCRGLCRQWRGIIYN